MTLLDTPAVPPPVPPDLARQLTNAAAKKADWHARRDVLIRQAVAAGHSGREVGRLTGLSHRAVQRIVERTDDP